MHHGRSALGARRRGVRLCARQKFSVMAGRSRSKNGALSHAYVPAIHVHAAAPRAYCMNQP
jgi:hypothetical protein